MSDDTLFALESIIDQHGCRAVLEALARICQRKANTPKLEPIRLTRLYEQVAKKLDRLSNMSMLFTIDRLEKR